ncbi:hypothetical protein JR316_0002925 [Psilocybe cubensis]|uniref:Uncharacterized protein n=2 Tax=Psilocybe cubensis TaxID=181762 RepID=A0ACB8H706_PSICU|nr:hypothetical protein JR316_0002925 [Psilocybe cubensis]KAH9483457.1 hypothetical protein JR316_0002925 [Psilocybe cubensis]
MDHLSSITAEGPLSPLSFFRDWQGSQLPLDPLHNEIYIPNTQLPRQLDQKERERGSHMNSDDENDTSPERRPYPPLLDMGIGHEWMTSPESVDTDLDDESVLSCSTSSLSPPYPDSDLRHFTDSEDYLDDLNDDDLYLPHAFASLGSNSTTPSPLTDIYHPLDQYPSHYQQLYKSITRTTSPTPPPLTLHEPPLSEPPPHPPPPIPEPSAQTSKEDPPLPTLLTATPTPARSPPSFGSPCEFDFDNGELIPCSPSRRRSTELPSMHDDTSGSDSTNQLSEPQPQRTAWLNLPGAETDDDLIPTELASKNYVPDPTITVPTSQPMHSLLIWGPTSATAFTFPSSCMSDFLPAAVRSPSPEASSIDLDLDPATLAELAPEGESEDAQKLWEMRVRKARSENWEKERCRELEALLRLKLRLDEKRADGASSGVDTDADATTGAMRAASHHSPPRRSSSSSKGRITNMAQLVANMVFHRQQEPSSPKRSHHPAPRSSSIVSSPQPSVAAGVKTHPTPRSPLRQVTLPDELEDEDEDEECLSPLSPLSPLTPFGLCESPLSFLTELDPIRMSDKEHDLS